MLLASASLLMLLGLLIAYPVGLTLAARLRRIAPGQPCGTGPRSVSVLLTCHNEAPELAGALDAILSGYPIGIPVQIVIASDASSDATAAIATHHADRGVVLVASPERVGKTALENAVREHLVGEVIVCMDAGSRPAAASMPLLLDAFRDPRVGVASSRDVMPANACSVESAWVAWEMWLRDLETRAGGTVGASGSLYAMRRDLFVALAPHAARDFATVLLASARGFSAVSTAATCVVRPAAGHRSKRRRWCRTMTQGIGTLVEYRAWLAPRKRPGFTIKVLLHKVTRWLLAPMVLVAMAGALLAGGSAFLKANLALGVLLLLLLALEARIARRTIGRVRLLSGAAAALLGALQSWVQVLRGCRPTIWEPTRRR